jgi:hypothetical protein
MFLGDKNDVVGGIICRDYNIFVVNNPLCVLIFGVRGEGYGIERHFQQ